MSAGTTATTGATVTLLPQSSWAPRAGLVIYCVRPDGEVVSDAVQLHITPTLKNKVSRSSSVHLSLMSLCQAAL